MMSHVLQRRGFLNCAGLGLGMTALGSLLADDAVRETASEGPGSGGLPGVPHFKPTAKRVIYLFMQGGPSQMDLFDHKPTLAKRHGEELPESVRMGQRITGMTAKQS